MANDRSWLRRLFRRGPERDHGPDVRRVLEAYGACLERRDTDRPYRSERELPYAKEEIGRAILTALKFTDRREIVEPLRHGFVELERFLADAEWRLIDEHQRLAAVGGVAGGMSDGQRAAVVRLREEIEARQDRRRQLLLILDEENSR